MIVKDEADELPVALASLDRFVDEIVVYDTGSTDDTVAIARRLGARVIEGYWDDDFSRARNACLEHCEGDWILWLDADESIHGDYQVARDLLATGGGCDAYLVAIESLEGIGLSGHVTFHATRLFRREACEWSSPIHEQVVLRKNGEIVSTRILSELQILHRGYTLSTQDQAAKIDRNLRLARLALEDPNADRPMALFNLGRTLIRTAHPEEGIAPLQEAADSTQNATLRLHALGALARLELMVGNYADAFLAVEELRRLSTRTGSADTIEAEIHLRLGDFATALDVLDRMDYLEVDETGIEIGYHTTVWMRARALAGLGRPGEAADVVLGVLSSHGILDEPIAVLVDYLARAGRQPEEIASAVRPESVAVFSAATAKLPLPLADRILAAVADRYPDRLEPIALASVIAPSLPISRALHWSALLRRRGLEESCPLIAISGDERIEPVVRLRASAAALATFGDQRAVETARATLAKLAPEEQMGAIADVAPISSVLAELLGSSTPTRAAHISRGAPPLQGYLNVSTVDNGEDLVVELESLPYGDESLHDLVVRDVLAAVPPERMARVLGEFFRVCQPGARLEVHVPNLEAAAAELIAGGSVEEARRTLFGPQRFGEDGTAEQNCNGWTAAALRAELEDSGFQVRRCIADSVIVAEAERIDLEVRRADSPMPRASVVVVVESGAASLLSCLRSFADDRVDAAYEVVLIDARCDPSIPAVFEMLQGDVTTLRPERPISRTTAFNLASAYVRGAISVVLSDRVVLEAGSLNAIIASFTDEEVVGASGVLVDTEGRVLHAGYDLFANVRQSRVEVIARGYLQGAAALDSDDRGEVAALGPGCFALRTELLRRSAGAQPGYNALDEVVDLSLRVVSFGGRLVLEPRCVARGFDAGEEDAASRKLLGHRWSRRAALPAPPIGRISAASLLPSTTLIERLATNSGLAIAASPGPGGVNLVGSLSGADPFSARAPALRDALAQVGMPVSTLSYHNGHLEPDEASEQLPYDTTVLAFDGEGFVAFGATAGLDAFRDRYTIANWYYQMAEPAPDTVAQAAMVAEIWTPSEFSRRALELATNRTVITMPPPVVAPVATDRAALQMPSGFVFASVVDCDSPFPGFVSRANPHGLVASFCEAFRARSGPSLFLRLLGGRAEATAEQCRQVAGGRADVVIVAGPGFAGEASAIVATADCYVSLHRSEAFGPRIAEALSVGRPVIATNYGGPLDYLEAGRDRLVSYELVPVGHGRRPYLAEDSWAEPDLNDAARALYETYEDQELANGRATSARPAILQRYGLVGAGAAMAARLAVIASLRASVGARSA